MPRVFDLLHVRVRIILQELVQKDLRREAPVLHAPNQRDLLVFKDVQPLSRTLQRLVRTMARRKRNVLHKFADGDTVRPGVVRREKPRFDVGSQSLSGRHTRRGAREDVEALKHDTFERGNVAESNTLRNAIA